MINTRDSARTTVFALLDAAAAVHHRLDRAVSTFKGISLSEFQLLRALSQEHKSTATRVDLAKAVGLTPSGVTRALRPLEKIGYIETRKDERDARRSMATLTAAGGRLVAQSTIIIDEAIADIEAIQELASRGSQQVHDFLEALIRER